MWRSQEKFLGQTYIANAVGVRKVMRRLSNNFLRHDLIIDFNLNFDSYLKLARG